MVACVRLDFGVRALQFHSLLGASQRVNRTLKNIPLHVAVEVAAVLSQLDQLRLALIGIEKHNAAVFGETQPWRDVRRMNLVGLPLCFEFLVEFDCFRRRRLRIARSVLYFPVASQSTSDLGISSHSLRSALR